MNIQRCQSFSRIKVAWLVTPVVEVGTGVLTLLQTWARHIDLQRFEPVVVVGAEVHSLPNRNFQLEPLRVIAVPELVSGKAFYWHGVRALAKIFAEEARISKRYG